MKDAKRSKLSKSPSSSEQMSDVKTKPETTKEKDGKDNKEKAKDKKLKKKAKKSDKEKEKKKRKRQKHSSEDELSRENDGGGKRRGDEKHSTSKKHDEGDDQDSKSKLKLEPFKVKESSNLKSQINFLNSSNIFTKDEWQKESSDDDLHHQRKPDESKDVASVATTTVAATAVARKVKLEPSDVPMDSVKTAKTSEVPEDGAKKSTTVATKDEKDDDNGGGGGGKERSRKRRRRASHSKTRESVVRASKHHDTTVAAAEEEKEKDKEKPVGKSSHESAPRKERSHSHGKEKVSEKKEKLRSKEHHKSGQQRSSGGGVAGGVDDVAVTGGGKKKVDDLFEEERIELPRTPTDAQYTGLFARLQEEPVSDTDIEDILPPILLDERMKALLVSDPNVVQEAWDSEDDALLARRDSVVAPKHRGVLESLAVPWSALIEEASLQRHRGQEDAGLSKFTVPNLLRNVGLSKQLAGDTLWAAALAHCAASPLLSPVAPVHQTLMSHKCRRNSIFCERGLFAGALSARKDLFIRRVLYEPMI